MTGPRHEITEWASKHGDVVAKDLLDAGSEATARRLVTRRKRTRVGALAACAVVAVGAIVVAAPDSFGGGPRVPAAHDTGPAELTLVKGEVPDILRCGQPYTLEGGFVLHTEARAGGLSGAWIKRSDDGSSEVNPTSIDGEYEGLVWRDVTPRHTGNGEDLLTIVAVQDGQIVGVSAAELPPGVGTDYEIPAPVPGECAAGDASSYDGSVEYHLVVQSFDKEGTLLATAIDIYDPLTVELKNVGQRPADTTRYSALPEPEGASYRAFVVAKPSIESCTPYSDYMLRGAPDAETMGYEVTIPGVQEFVGEIWGNSPAAVIDDPNYDAWYVGLPTAITAERVDAGNPLATLEWTTGPAVGETDGTGQLRLVTTWDAAPVVELPGDCAFEAPIPDIDGAVFLIIDGVDFEALDEANPGADFANLDNFQTWVYLGQAS